MVRWKAMSLERASASISRTRSMSAMKDPSFRCRPKPLPCTVVRSFSGTPGVSQASVVSTPMPMSGCTPKAAVLAPRRPTSSWAVKATVSSQSWVSPASTSLRTASRPSQQAMRLSSALETIFSPISSKGSFITTKSPTCTMSLVAAPWPISTKNSFGSGIFLRSSADWMWIGLPSAFITPLKSPSSVQTRTRRENKLRGSKPPTGSM